ncbi:MAG TPA: hypothetical protein VNR36_01710 [Pseudolysinimonas sp.]|nr:hypothetical protein [Pseudolysinimonas sp.]
MVWRIVLLTIALQASALGSVDAATCSGSAAISGCINNGGVDVVGTTGSPGGGGGSGGGGGGGTGTGDGPPVIWKCMEKTCGSDDPGAEPITLTDIAHFRPTPGSQRMQPDGWTVPGLETNFYAITGAHIVRGELLGEDADVRFTPVAYHWTYGDGSSATHTTKGGTWVKLGIREFERTPTSHVYRRDGAYTIRLVIDFRAEYRFAGSAFIPIPGILPLRANDLHIVADGAKTVLVERDCATDPTGPGC